MLFYWLDKNTFLSKQASCIIKYERFKFIKYKKKLN